MKNCILILAALLLPTLLCAQTPTIYDDWYPGLVGKMAHFSVSENSVTIYFATGTPEISSLASAITTPSAVSGIVPKADTVRPKSTTVPLLKVVFDSAQSKGRLFVRIPENSDSLILGFSFLLHDNGVADLGVLFESLNGALSGKHPTLKQVMNATRPGAKKNSKSQNSWAAVFGIGDTYRINCYNSARAAEFNKMKDPEQLPKEEILGMINSFGDRIIADLQDIQVPSGDIVQSMGFIAPILMKSQTIATDLFIAHGYNPMSFFSFVKKIQGDSVFSEAITSLGDKIEESVPALREKKLQKQARTRQRFTAAVHDLDSLCSVRVELTGQYLNEARRYPDLDQKVIGDLLAAQKEASGLRLTEDILIDSVKFKHFQTVQNNLTANFYLLSVTDPEPGSAFEKISSKLREATNEFNANRRLYNISLPAYNKILRKSTSARCLSFEAPDQAPLPLPAQFEQRKESDEK